MGAVKLPRRLCHPEVTIYSEVVKNNVIEEPFLINRSPSGMSLTSPPFSIPLVDPTRSASANSHPEGKEPSQRKGERDSQTARDRGAQNPTWAFIRGVRAIRGPMMAVNEWLTRFQRLGLKGSVDPCVGRRGLGERSDRRMDSEVNFTLH